MRSLTCYSLLFSILFVFLIPTLSFAQIEVTSVADSGPGSLREAIETTAIDGNIITFDLVGPPPHTITLTSGEITIDNSITINGPGSDDLIISGNDSSRIFRIDDGDGGNFLDVFIRDVTIRDGNVSLITPVVGAVGGGAILNLENLTLETCVLSNSFTLNVLGGGAIYSSGGILNINSCDILQNEVVHNHPGDPDEYISFNVYGGGVYNELGEFNLNLSNISENLVRNVNVDPIPPPSTIRQQFDVFGGGIYNDRGALTITQSCISDNMLLNPLTNNVEDRFIRHLARGGGIATFLGSLTISHSTISNNVADGKETIGGGLYAEGMLTAPANFPTGIIVNSTFSGNVAVDEVASFGGGIGVVGFNLDISSSTIAFNFAVARFPAAFPSGGAGIYAASSFFSTVALQSTIITLRNTLVVGNRITFPPAPIVNSLDDSGFVEELGTDFTTRGLAPPPENCDADFNSMFTPIFIFEGNNISDISSFLDFCASAFDPQFDASTMLAPLADNGGFCETNALINVPNNNAIDGVPDGECTDQAMPPNTLDIDERNFLRPVNFTTTPVALCDIGAFELQAIASITIAKETLPLGGTNFDFTSTGFPLGCDLMDSFMLDDAESLSCMLPLGTYTVTETVPSNFILDSITCMGGAMTSTDADTATIDLMNFEDVVCTFSNVQQFTLDVTIEGSGQGGVTSTAPGEIDCSNTGAINCMEVYDPDDTVTLTAAPEPDSIFAGWSGDTACTGDPLNPVLDLTMNMDISCIATFAALVDLDIAIQGNGQGGVLSTNPGIDCNSTGSMDCDETYNPGTQVTLTATPDPGSNFTGWSGDGACTGDPSNPILNLSMDMDISCIATFALDPVTLDVVIQGIGSCTVSSVPTGINCVDNQGDCSETYDPPGVTIDLTVIPSDNSLFTGWSGDCSGEDPNTSITVNTNSTCIATCGLSEFVLNPVFPALDDNINSISAENASPSGRVAFTWAKSTGSLTIGGRVCGGTQLGLRNPKLLSIVRANDFGVATHIFYIPTFNDLAFQLELQAVDIQTCRTSNIVPQIIRKDESG